MHMLITMYPDTPDKWADLLWKSIRRLNKDPRYATCHIAIHNEAAAARYVHDYRLPFTPVAVVIFTEKGGAINTRNYVYIKDGKLVQKPLSKYPLIPKTKGRTGKTPTEETW